MSILQESTFRRGQLLLLVLGNFVVNKGAVTFDHGPGDDLLELLSTEDKSIAFETCGGVIIELTVDHILNFLIQSLPHHIGQCLFPVIQEIDSINTVFKEVINHIVDNIIDVVILGNVYGYFRQ